MTHIPSRAGVSPAPAQAERHALGLHISQFIERRTAVVVAFAVNDFEEGRQLANQLRTLPELSGDRIFAFVSRRDPSVTYLSPEVING